MTTMTKQTIKHVGRGPSLANQVRRRRRGRGQLSRPVKLTISTVAIVIAFVIWQVLASAKVIDPLVASSPLDIWHAFGRLSDNGLGTQTLQTAKLFAEGFLVSLVFGFVIGVLVGWYGVVDAVLSPFVSTLYAAPRIALIPLILVWWGIGFTAQVVVVVLTAVFPIIINVASGVATADRQLVTMASSFGAGRWRILRTVALPAAAPAIVSGVRQGVAQSLIGVVVAEYFIGNDGIGGMIVNSGTTLDTAAAFAGVVIFAVAALVLNALLGYVQHRVDRWRP